jgi:hypothetical protein
MTGRVFIPQETRRKTPDGNAFVFDFTPALKYGAIHVIVPPGPPLISLASVLPQMREKMRGFCDDDYVVATGDPALIAAACMIGGWYNSGRVKVLRWDRFTRDYAVLDLDERDLLAENT